MGEFIKRKGVAVSEYDFIIDNMQWSFSRLNQFCQCPYAFKKQYIDCEEGESNALAEYGSVMHKVLEDYAKGEIDIFQLNEYYNYLFETAIEHDFPPNSYVDLRESYYNKGKEYLENINLELERYEILGVEKEVNFEIDSYKMIGFIDLLLRDKETGEIITNDHKSAQIKILKNGNVSKTDKAHFEEFKKQQYLYCKPIIEEYGKVDFLQWNLFKEQNFIKIPFSEREYEESLKWVTDTIEQIKNEVMWLPCSNYFRCNNICNFRNDCEYKDLTE